MRVLGQALCVGGLALAASAGSAAAREHIDFVPSPAGMRQACASTAKAVGYPVPCPLAVPRGLVADSGGHGCRGGLVLAPFRSAATCQGARGWRGWVAGAGSAPGGVGFALTASPRAEPDIARLVNGPAWYPAARVQPLGRSRVGGRDVRWASVPAATNDGSQFSGTVVATWRAGGHSYAIGFRSPGGPAAARALDERLLEHVALVAAGP